MIRRALVVGCGCLQLQVFSGQQFDQDKTVVSHASDTPTVGLDWTGALELADGAKMTLEFGREKWQRRAMPRPDKLITSGEGLLIGVSGELRNDCGQPRDGFFNVRCENSPNGGVDYTYEVVSDRTQQPAALGLVVYLPDQGMKGAEWMLGAVQRGVLPDASGPVFGATGLTRRFVLQLPYADRRFTFETDEPVCVSLSNRDFKRHGGWAVYFPLGNGLFAKGTKRTMKLHVGSADGGLAVREQRPYRIAPGREWIPLDHRKDIEPGSALDFSSLRLLDAPAGKYGWVRNVNGHFEFEGRSGAPQRFCGMNLCGRSLFPTHEQADVLAERFARLGYNAFRIHTFEWKLLAGSMDSLEPDPAAMDRLDYLYAALVKRGCYATVDLFACRCLPYFWRRDAGIDRDGEMKRTNYKVLVKVSDSAFENWARFARNFMRHRNPYTGLCYAEDPAMPFVVFVNEERHGWTNEGGLRIPEVRSAYRKWLSDRRKAMPSFAPRAPDDCADGLVSDPVIALFKADVDLAFVCRARSYLRSIGIKALFSGFNCGDDETSLLPAKSMLDYTDTHIYVDHPVFTDHGYPHRISGNIPPCECDVLSEAAFLRLPDKPFVVSEWNLGGMSKYRGSGGLSFGAFAAIQGWSALWRFAYSDGGEWWRSDGEGAYRTFSSSCDPMMLASERAVTCLFLRGDMNPARRSLSLIADSVDELQGVNGKAMTVVPKWKSIALGCRVGASERSASGWESFDAMRWGGGNAVPPVTVVPATGLFADREERTLKVVTSKTAGGFSFPGRMLDCGILRFTPGKTAAAVWASSLDGDDLPRSSRILVSHLTDAQRAGAEYFDDSQTVLFHAGDGDLLMRDGEVEIDLRLEDPAGYRVFALRSDGHRLGEIPVRAVNGRLLFVVTVGGREGASYLYEVSK